MSFQLLSEKVGRARFEHDAAARTFDNESAALLVVENRLECTKQAQVLTQGVAKTIQDRTYSCIAGIVTQCLSAIFEEPYEFKVEFVTKRGNTEANLTFLRQGEKVDPMSGSGGGVVDVAAFALRLASLVLMGSRTSRILVLDEPFKFLSAEYRSKVRELLLLLSDEMGIQIIMVTHIHELECGKVISL